MKRITATALLCALPLMAHSATLGDFSQVIYFGDSFSDGGAALALAGPAAVPPAIYPNGQLTNGDVWAVQLGGTFANGTNFAVGGAEAIAEPGDISPDLSAQVSSFAASGVPLGANPLGAVLIGGNDLGEASDLAEVAAIGTAVIGAITTNVQRMIDNGLSTVAVFGLPDLGIFPSVRADGLGPIATAYTPIYNAELQAALAANFDPAEIIYFDTFTVFDEIFTDPGAFGITDTLQPCLLDVAACLAGDPNTFFFYDDVHPTEVVHTALAAAVRAQLAPTPVPLPAGAALLLSGLALLVWGRRRAPSRIGTHLAPTARTP